MATTNAAQLLVTKLKPAVSLASAISRPRLLSLVGDTALPKIVLVTAGAGFGKSTLLAQWYETVAARAGWVSLDRNDQDPIGFVRYVIAALNQPGSVISAATESYIEGRTTLNLDEISTRLGNDLAELKEHRIVFLDDYYLAETPVIDDLMTELIGRSPPACHFVIASRTLPALPVARLKAHNNLLEISAGELKFNQPETETFMHVARKLDLGPSEMRVLSERTEGWAAGLQLASLYLKNSKDLKRSIEELSGGVRDITDYLATDVVRRLSPDLQEFLLKTSVLERMNASVCNALLNRGDGQSQLEAIEAMGLFLFPMDATREWYRYHHLFRDYLRIQLKRQEPTLVRELYHKASAWFAAAGFADEAVDMALEAGDFDEVARLMESSAMNLIINGYMPQVNRWIQRLPEHVINERHRFPTFRCWALVHLGKCDQAEALLAHAEVAFEQLREGTDAICEDEQDRLRDELHTLRALNAVMRDDVDRAYELARVTFPDRPEFALYSGALANVLGLSAIARGEFEVAKTAGDAATRFHRISGASYGVVYGYCVKGLAHRAQGQLSAAMAEMEAGEATACRAVGPKSFSAAMPRVLKGVLLYERNLLDEAYSILQDNLPLVEECAYIESRTAAFLAMAGILSARGQVEAALRRLDQAISVSSECNIDRTRALVNHEGVRLRLAAGDVAGARRFARHVGIDNSLGVPAEWKRPVVFRALAQCRLLIAEGKAKQAIPCLDALAQLAAKTGRVLRHVEILTLLAVACTKAQQRVRTVGIIGDILRIGAGEGYLRSIVDQGREAAQLFLDFARERSSASLSPDSAAYLEELCAAFAKENRVREVSQSGKQSISAHAAPDNLAEALTEQEMKVLHLMAAGAPNSQIAEVLSISTNTVRWHVANILSKLQVENRTQAASVAHTLGLIG